MAAAQSGDFEETGHGLCGGVVEFDMPGSRRVAASRASDVQLAFLFGIEIHEDPASHKVAAEALGAGQPSFFVHGEEEFQGAVFQRFVLHDSQIGGDGDAVVGAQGRAVGHDQVAGAHQFDRIFVEVVNLVLFFSPTISRWPWRTMVGRPPAPARRAC